MLSTYLQAYFKKSHIPMAEVARRSGVSLATVSRMRSGEIDNPLWLTVVSVFQAMGGSLDAAAEIVSSDLPQLFVLEQKNAALEERLKDSHTQLEQERTWRLEERDNYQKEHRFLRRVCLYLIIGVVFMCYLFVDARNADWGLFQDSTANTFAPQYLFYLIIAVAAAVALSSFVASRRSK